MLLKIGELAKRTGLTVRTLHHYDAIGLLTPSARSDAGYRLYNRSDIERLHRIQALRQLDLSLSEIGDLLQGEGADLHAIIKQQIVSLDRQMTRVAELRDRLRVLLTHLDRDIEPDLPDWLITLEMMAIYDRYFTSEDLKAMRVPSLGEQFKKGKDSQWPPLIAAVHDLMDRGVPPTDSEAEALAVRWLALVWNDMAGDARLILKLDAMHRNEPTVQVRTGIDGAVIDYISMAAAQRRLTLYGKYLTPEELERIRPAYGKNDLQWAILVAEVRQQMEQGASPHSPEVQVLASRWRVLSRELWGNDSALLTKLRYIHMNEPDILAGTGIDRTMLEFIWQGIESLAIQHQ